MRVPRELKEKWVAALRSGNYRQGRNSLHNAMQDSYCCLGVLEMVADGEVETWTTPQYGSTSKALPTTDFYERHSIDCTGAVHFASMNDDGASFHDIADAIEANVGVCEAAAGVRETNDVT